MNAFARYRGVDYPVTPIDRSNTTRSPTRQRAAFRSCCSTTVPIRRDGNALPGAESGDDAVFRQSYLQIQSFADKDASITLPPGYARALIFNLACEIAPDYNKEPGPSLLKSAAESKGILKRNNRQDVTMKFDYALLYGSPAYNVYSDTYR